MTVPKFDTGIAAALLQSDDFIAKLGEKLNKADTINQATGLLWYDLRPIVQMLYPFKELIPLISKLPRVNADGGNAFHWKRITGINVNKISIGVSEGNRGGRIAITEQDQQASYKTMGLESSVTFQARWGSKNLSPEALGIAIQSTLRSTMIGEEQCLILGNASMPLGTTPTPTLSAGGTTGAWGGSVTVYVMAVALSGYGLALYTPYNSGTQTGGVPGQIVRANADGSSDTFGGGSAQPSAEASVAATIAQVVTASVVPVPGAVAYAWFVGTASGQETLAGITAGNQAIFAANPGNTAQPVTALKVGASYQDNSTNTLLPDGILTMIYGSVFGSAPGTAMSTNPNLPVIVNGTLSLANSGAVVCTMDTANTGLTINGSNIVEFDAVLQAAYEQYKVGFTKILMSATDLLNSTGAMFNSNATSQFRIMFQAEQASGRIVAGRRITSYMNKFFGNTLDIEVHPFIPAGTILFWSDNVPYELSGVQNILEAHVRQDYYQLQWPITTMRYEYGVYVDEVFAGYFMPAFAVITNLNQTTGTPVFPPA